MGALKKKAYNFEQLKKKERKEKNKIALFFAEMHQNHSKALKIRKELTRAGRSGQWETTTTQSAFLEAIKTTVFSF